MLYQEDGTQGHSEAGNVNNGDREDYDVYVFNVADAVGDTGVRIRRTLTATTVIQDRELGDGEEDLNYCPEEVRHYREMSDWFPDRVVSKTLHPSTSWPDTTATDTRANIVSTDDGGSNQ